MFVAQRLVTVPVRMRFSDRLVVSVLVMVMVVMHMSMLVFERFVGMVVFVSFGEVQPEPDCHQHASGGQLQGEPVAEHDQ